MAEAIVKISNLKKQYSGQIVVNGIDFEVYQGECLGILGPNGAGKTTTLRMLLGLTYPDSGELSVLGYNLPEQASLLRREVGVVPQQDNLDVDFSVIENLRMFASYFGVKGAELEERIEQLLKFASLTEKTNHRVEALSGGMQRRLTLARALINNPKLLVLDEPSTGLDPQARQMIWQRLRGLLAEDRTLIMTTHYMEEAQRLCDRLILVDHGKVLAVGTPNQLIVQNIESHVIEIYGKKQANGLEDKLMSGLVSRVENVGETLFCYTNDETAVLEWLKDQAQIEYLHRRANLEDVFMKLTGRELRDG